MQYGKHQTFEQLWALLLHEAKWMPYLVQADSWTTLWSAKLNNLIFHSLDIVPRYRDPQLQVSKN